jgi:hypothetical protein
MASCVIHDRSFIAKPSRDYRSVSYPLRIDGAYYATCQNRGYHAFMYLFLYRNGIANTNQENARDMEGMAGFLN